MLDLDRRLHIGLAEGIIQRPAAVVTFRQPSKHILARLTHSGPIPGLAGRHLLRSDIDMFQPASSLALWSVGNDFESIIAVDQRNIFKGIALGPGRTAKCKQFSVAIEFGIPSGGQVPFKPRPIEGGGTEQRRIGDLNATSARSFDQPALYAL